MKQFRYLIEFIFAFLFVKFLQLMPIWMASNFCGFLCRFLLFFIGKFTGENERGIRNLNIPFSTLALKEKINILKSSYENIGRFIGEYVNQHKMNEKWFKKNVEVVNGDYICNQVKSGCFIFTGHFGNWEVMQRFLLLYGVNLNVIYNPISNPYNNKLYLKQRKVNQLAKGSGAMKQILNLIKNKKSIGILVDQRDKQGEIFKFFDRDAKTSVAIQRLSLKHNYNMVPVKCERRLDNKNKFILTGFSSLTQKDIAKHDALRELTNQSLRIVEDWIKYNPGNWLLWNYSRWRIKFD